MGGGWREMEAFKTRGALFLFFFTFSKSPNKQYTMYTNNQNTTFVTTFEHRGMNGRQYCLPVIAVILEPPSH